MIQEERSIFWEAIISFICEKCRMSIVLIVSVGVGTEIELLDCVGLCVCVCVCVCVELDEERSLQKEGGCTRHEANFWLVS